MTSSTVLIDGSNFYFKLKENGFNNLLSFKFEKFVQHLTLNSVCKQSYYYVGKIRQDGSRKAELMHSQQQKLLTHLRNNNIEYKLGFLLKTDRYHEKGVDVQIATDILVISYEKIARKIFLVSSDTDIIPAIIKSKELNIEIIYVGFKSKPSYALMKASSSYCLLNKSDIAAFL